MVFTSERGSDDSRFVPDDHPPPTCFYLNGWAAWGLQLHGNNAGKLARMLVEIRRRSSVVVR